MTEKEDILKNVKYTGGQCKLVTNVLCYKFGVTL